MCVFVCVCEFVRVHLSAFLPRGNAGASTLPYAPFRSVLLGNMKEQSQNIACSHGVSRQEPSEMLVVPLVVSNRCPQYRRSQNARVPFGFPMPTKQSFTIWRNPGNEIVMPPERSAREAGLRRPFKLKLRAQLWVIQAHHDDGP